MNSISNKVEQVKENIVLKYYQELGNIFSKIDLIESNAFAPTFDLPELTDQVKKFFSPATMSCSTLGNYQGKNIFLLNLMENPETETTKTIPSLLMVARAVCHIQKTDEKIK